MGWEIIGLPGAVSIAIVATLGYLVGQRQPSPAVEENCARQEMKRAKAVLNQLAAISLQMRQSLAQHHSTVMNFKSRLDRFQARTDTLSLRELTDEADRLLAPTQVLADSIADAYEGIRRQTRQLSPRARMQIDTLTGVGNSRSLDENLRLLLGLRQKCNVPFSLALFEVSQFDEFTAREGRRAADAVLREMATILDGRSRDSDQVARLENSRFAVLLSHTNEAGAVAFSNRMQQFLTIGLPVTCHCGVTEATADDSPVTLLGRAHGRMLSPATIEVTASKSTTETRTMTVHDVPHAGPSRRVSLAERIDSELLSQ